MKNKVIFTTVLLLLAMMVGTYGVKGQKRDNNDESRTRFDRLIDKNGKQMIAQGRQTFRFDTFGDQAFWGDTLQLHQAIEGAKLGGVGPGVSPKTALAVGLKVDSGRASTGLVSEPRRKAKSISMTLRPHWRCLNLTPSLA